MISPSCEVEVTSSAAGSVSRSITSEW